MRMNIVNWIMTLYRFSSICICISIIFESKQATYKEVIVTVAFKAGIS